ncbi:MAG: hypothetical protein SP4CHLAM5_02140 [Chlamydiia bacterium]|nr:hypothetical protein [Chlamydiia bacterium]MCH9618088.1 hypothetical protein [Chlamydiia bacterium]
MKKLMLFSILSAFCLSLTSCGMMDKKDKKDKKHSPPSHRRYHSELVSEE